MSWDEVDAIGSGRVFTGVQARENGLIDEVGGFDIALIEAKGLAGIDVDAEVRLVDFPRAKPWWQQFVKKKSDDQVAIESVLREYETMMRTGTIRLPGEVWMPPVVLE